MASIFDEHKRRNAIGKVHRIDARCRAEALATPGESAEICYKPPEEAKDALSNPDADRHREDRRDWLFDARFECRHISRPDAVGQSAGANGPTLE